jgi:hypothetical protein
MSDREIEIFFDNKPIKYVEIEQYDYEPRVDRSLTSIWSTELAKQLELSNEDYLTHEPSYRDVDGIKIERTERYVIIEYISKGNVPVTKYIPNHAILNITCMDKLPINAYDLSEQELEANK